MSNIDKKRAIMLIYKYHCESHIEIYSQMPSSCSKDLPFVSGTNL